MVCVIYFESTRIIVDRVNKMHSITCKVESKRTVPFHAVPFGREVCCKYPDWLLLAWWAVIAQWVWLWFYEKNNVYSSLTFTVIRLRFSYDHGSKIQLVYWVHRKVMNLFQKIKPNACLDHGFYQRITSRTSNRKKPFKYILRWSSSSKFPPLIERKNHSHGRGSWFNLLGGIPNLLCLLHPTKYWAFFF